MLTREVSFVAILPLDMTHINYKEVLAQGNLILGSGMYMHYTVLLCSGSIYTIPSHIPDSAK